MMTGVLECMGAGSLGMTGRGAEEMVLPSVSVTSWSAWSSSWGWMRSQARVYVSGLKRGAGRGDVIVGGLLQAT